MIKLNSVFQKILIIASFSMLLATIIISSIAIDYIKQEKIRERARSQNDQDQPPAEIFKAGIVGEIKKSDNTENTIVSGQGVQAPPILFNTTGIISEIKSDRLIVKGDGTNFADGVARDLNAVFTEQTIVYIRESQNVIKYDGLEGLKHLNAGNNISIGGDENLRGKTEFKVKTINILL